MNLKSVRNQIEVLESIIEEKETKRDSKTPFVVYHPWSIFLNQYNVIYYPKGNKTPENEVIKLNKVRVLTGLEFIAGLPKNTRVHGNMTHCEEWMHVFYQENPDYNKEQKERMLIEAIEKRPYLLLLYLEGQTLCEGTLYDFLNNEVPENWNTTSDHIAKTLKSFECYKDVEFKGVDNN